MPHQKFEKIVSTHNHLLLGTVLVLSCGPGSMDGSDTDGKAKLILDGRSVTAIGQSLGDFLEMVAGGERVTAPP